MMKRLYGSVRRRLAAASLELHRRSILKHYLGGGSLHLEGKITVVEAGKLTLGQNVHIGSRAYLNCAGGISIGDHSVLSRNVTVYSYDHNFRNPSVLPYDGDIICRPVSIGRYVWIGMNVTIAPGTVIGNGAVVGMGATVAGNIPENAIVVSAKHRVVGYRDAERVAALVEAGRYVPN